MELVQPQKHPTIQCRYSILGCQSPQKTPKMLLAVYSLFHSNISTEKKNQEHSAAKGLQEAARFGPKQHLLLSLLGTHPAGVSNLLKTFALNLTLFL